MARKESLDRALLARVQAQFQTTDVDSLLRTPSDDLLSYIRKVPLVYGFWGDFKRLVKAAEKSTEPEPIAALLARLDMADLPRHSPRLPDSPLDTPINSVGRMVFDGTSIYLICQDWRARGVHIVDMTLPAAPTVLVQLKMDNVVDLAVSGTKMFLLQGDAWNTKARLSCYDVTDPRQPKPLGGVTVAGGTRLAVSGSLVGVIVPQGRHPGLQLVDATQPAHLHLSAHLACSPTAIQMGEQTAYIAAQTPKHRPDNLLIIDLSNPLQPRQVKEIPIPSADNLVVQGRYAYIACSLDNYARAEVPAGLAVVDLAPTGLARFAGARQIAMLPIAHIAYLAVQGRYAYLSVGREGYGVKNTAGLRIVDIGDPAHPHQVGSLLADSSGAVVAAGEAVCISLETGWSNQFHALHVAEPARPLLMGTSPARETLGYMKRRARRLLHTLALRDPEAYVHTVTQLLIEIGQAQPKLDPRLQWISMDLIYGGGTRYVQHGHGRGSYGSRRPGLSLKTREERFPELWNRYPEMATQLYTTPKLPPQTWEMAGRILLSTGHPLPPLNDRMLAHFLSADSALLRSIAIRQVVATLETGRRVAADIVADTYVNGTRRHRQVIDRYMNQQSPDARWTSPFATRLYMLASGAVDGPRLSRKATQAFVLLISQYPALFQRDLQPSTVIALYNTGRRDFRDWTLEVLRNLLPAQLPEWLATLELLPEEAREAAVAAIQSGIQTKEFLPRTVEALIQHTSAWVRQMGWRILAQIRTALPSISTIWSDLLNSQEPTPALLTAFASEDALVLFARCDFDSQMMASRLDAHPFLIPLLPLAALAKVVAVLPPSAVLRLVAEASEAQWPGLMSSLLIGPLLPENRAAFWREAFAAIGATGDANLIRRLLDSPQMQMSFFQVADISEYLRSANPVFGPLLGQWIALHTDRLFRDSPELLQIATHPLPEVRNIGLDRVRRIGLNLPFALRLLESELPPSVTLGKSFFEQMKTEDTWLTEALTALCDSPKSSVRAYGREVLTARPELLVDTEILERLGENPDPETQAFVAGRLLTQPTQQERTAAFDRAVLRSRDKARRAKELVKLRLDGQPTPDIPLLLEMARSRTPRDAEWAMTQLAKLALDGVEIPGFTLDGVAGG